MGRFPCTPDVIRNTMGYVLSIDSITPWCHSEMVQTERALLGRAWQAQRPLISECISAFRGLSDLLGICRLFHELWNGREIKNNYLTTPHLQKRSTVIWSSEYLDCYQVNEAIKGHHHVAFVSDWLYVSNLSSRGKLPYSEFTRL